jgi:long-chain-acyl-CoA dehydrogenase
VERIIFEEEHRAFRKSFGAWVDTEVAPHHEQWEQDGIVPRDLWRKAGEQGFLCTDVPTEYGGGGVTDYRYNVIIQEELIRVGASGVGFALHNDIVVPYLLKHASEEQKQRWFPGMCDGTLITAIAMTEPATGSDLAGIKTTAIRDGDHYVVNGSKTFITNGINSDLVIVVVKTDPSQAHGGMSLIMVEDGMEGFHRGRNLEKLGMHAQDTAELFFDNVRVPVDNLIGEEGQGFMYLVGALPQERLSIAVAAVSGAEQALELTLNYVKERTAFGKAVGSFQNSRFQLAEMKTNITIARAYVDRCITEHNAGNLSVEDAAMAKYWTTDMIWDVVDRCVQLHGGYGYMWEYPITRAMADARVMRIYGGTNEIMKEIIGRGMGV